MGVGGTLGITSAFEREDTGLQRHLITNQIATLDEAARKYNGMILHCTEQLELDAAAYATLPAPPPLLETQPVPPLLSRVLGPAAVQGFGLGCPISIVVLVAVFITPTGSPVRTFLAGLPGGDTIFKLYPYSVFLVALVIAVINYARRAQVIAANGTHPEENAKRLQTHKDLTEAALRKAVPLKDATDHKLRRQIVEVEGQLAAAVRRRKELQALLDGLPAEDTR